MWSSCQTHTLKLYLTSTQLYISKLDTSYLNSHAATTLVMPITHCLINGFEWEIQSKE